MYEYMYRRHAIADMWRLELSVGTGSLLPREFQILNLRFGMGNIIHWTISLSGNKPRFLVCDITQ